jgi:hypothetical protein
MAHNPNTYDPDDYDWHHPGDVLTVHDGDFNVIAYGVPSSSVAVPTSEPEDRPYTTPPLPRPPHNNEVGEKCLGCEWVGLKRRMQDAGYDVS